MKKNLFTIAIYALMIGTLAFGFTALAQYNISQTSKAESIADEYDIPVNIINKRTNDGMSIEQLEEDLASGKLTYREGQLVYSDYVSW